MKKQAGIWIDTQKAFVVILNGDSPVTKTIHSGIESKVRIPGESKEYTRFGNQYYDNESKKEERVKHELKTFLRDVVNEIKNTDEVLIFGPAGMKKELEKSVLNEKNIRASIRAVQAADSMTDNQMIARVKTFFSSN